MTMLHLAVIFLFSALSRALVQCSSHRARVVLSWTDYLRRVAPTGRSSMRRAAGEPRLEIRGAPWPRGHALPLLLTPFPLLHLSKEAAPLSLLAHVGLSGPRQVPNGSLAAVATQGWAKRFPRTSLDLKGPWEPLALGV